MSWLNLPQSDEEIPDHKTLKFPEAYQTKERNYDHFDLRLSDQQRTAFTKTHEFKEKHRFLPLLGYTNFTRRVRKLDDGTIQAKIKPRNIRYASHTDAAYLEAYGLALNEPYEAYLKSGALSKTVLAYRSTGLTNIDHAKSLFAEIRLRQDCTVVALDISAFFDTLDHKLLRQEILRVKGETELSEVEWSIFKNMTKFSWVEIADLDTILGKLRDRPGRICSPDAFKEHIRDDKTLVRSNEMPFGIPQGLPISGLLANIYMLTFDETISKMVEKCGGSYRRYSDDIAIVIPPNMKAKHISQIVLKVASESHLSISDEKTEICEFRDGIASKDTSHIQYLGFTFDGEKTLLRESTILTYKKKMQRGIRAKMLAARQHGIPASNTYKRELLSRYTHLGKRRNFVKYALRCADEMNAPEIRQQVKRHMTWFKSAWIRESFRATRYVIDKD